jgi:hypothetical protein
MSNESPQEVYLPSPNVVANANIKSYEEMARCADRTSRLWARRANSYG